MDRVKEALARWEKERDMCSLCFASPGRPHQTIEYTDNTSEPCPMGEAIAYLSDVSDTSPDA